ncbi:MAG: S-layer homology domain-containing protein [Clostridia bacterium]|nr:S-layer homology domain-containing protein [Clostridia bacterium]
MKVKRMITVMLVITMAMALFSTTALADGYYLPEPMNINENFLLVRAEDDTAAVEYTYDELGRLIKEVNYEFDDILQTTTYTYNEKGQIEKAIYTVTFGNIDTAICTYIYDNAGCLQKREYADGTVQTYSYDSAGRLVKIEQIAEGVLPYETTYTYDDAGRLIKDNDYTYTYDASGHLIKRTDAYDNNKYVAYTYDSQGLVNKRTYNGGNYTETIEYDANGNHVRTLNDTTVVESFTYVSASNAGPFADVKSSDWFLKDVEYVKEKGLMSGIGDNKFNPQGDTTRGMIVTILYRMENEPSVSVGCSFSDVASGSYYEKAITWASEKNIVGGYGGGKFGPNDPITREQFAVILYNYCQYKGYNTSGSTNISAYSDGNRISSYAVDAMKWAVNSGLITGTGDNRLDPISGATRAQSAAILHRFGEKIK